MKPIMITLMYLTFGGEIKMDTFEIHTTCGSWFHTNVAQIENKKTTLFRSRTYHVYKDKRVVGYICGGEEPR
tara:strand:+ start:552 stop:767 length:216 start_codon:yes stop_codon:yes gene_type:complete